MKNILILFCLIIFSLPVFATREYYIKNYNNLQFLCFSENECYSINPDIITIKNKKFVGFGGFHYFDINTYKYNENIDTYTVDVVVDRDPSTDLEVCNKCPFDKGNITHLIFTLTYSPSKNIFKGEYKGFISSEDIVQYKNNKPIGIYINYLNIYYNNNPKLIKDLSYWLRFFNKEIAKTFRQPNGYVYDTEIEYIIPYFVNILHDQYNPMD